MEDSLTYQSFYIKVFETLPNFKNLKVFEDWKEDINEGYVATMVLSDIAREMMKSVERGDENVCDLLLTLIENTLKNHPNSEVSAFIGTDFLVTILEYPMSKELKEKIKNKMGKETMLGYNIAKSGYDEIFK